MNNYNLTNDDLENGKLYVRQDDPNCVIYKEKNDQHWSYRSTDHRTIYISFDEKLRFREVSLDEAIDLGLFPNWDTEERTNYNHYRNMLNLILPKISKEN
jgi:hypothetical protein